MKKTLASAENFDFTAIGFTFGGIFLCILVGRKLRIKKSTRSRARS
jgi:hypothetical protein